MKVLFLNPHLHAGHAVAKGLQAKGFALLLASDAKEAWQMMQLHGASLDLAIVHREDEPGKDNEGGFKFIAKLKGTPQFADLPTIVTSQVWGDSQFAKHQETPQGANAYLRWPFDAAAMYKLCEAVFGGTIPQSDASRAIKQPTRADLPAPPKAPGAAKSGPPSKAPPAGKPPARGKAPPSGAPGELVLEDASNLFSRNDRHERSDTSIRLEMPEPDAPAPAAKAPAPAPAPEPGGGGLSLDSPSATSVELGGARGGAGDIPMPEAPSISLHAIPSSGGLGTNASIEEILDAPPGSLEPSEPPEASDGRTTVGVGGGDGAGDGKTTVGGFGGAGDAKTTVGGFELGGGGDGKTTVGGFGGIGGAGSDGKTTVGGFGERPAPPKSKGRRPPRAPEPDPDDFEDAAESDAHAAQDMPYLFQGGAGGKGAGGGGRGRPAAPLSFGLPQGDAVVPGGAARAPDIETLKKYLLLREQDVAVLSGQLKAAKDQLKSIDEQLRLERGRCSELGHITSEQKRKLEEFEKDKQQELDRVNSELSEIRFQLKAKTDKARVLDGQVREAAEEMERLKERVRADIRKIRVREKELENRLEIMKKDSEALISARENKIIELKRKLDLLEFNMDLLQDQHAREKETSSRLRERLAKAAQVVRVAGGLLDNPAGASQLAAVLSGSDLDDGGKGEDAA